jgi:hypothetical protein
MVKFTESLATKDDPIFTGRFTVSSVKPPQELKKPKKTSHDATVVQSMVKGKPAKEDK